jgi:DNA-binding NtrC family response regulator
VNAGTTEAKGAASTALGVREPEMNTVKTSQKRVLLADDDRSIRDALGAVLESEGFDVIRAANGNEAVEKFCEHRADIVLLDLNMPVKGGWETFERLTSIDPLLPAIVITARPDAYPTATAAGVAALMQKPLDIPRLLEAMRDLLAEPAEQRLSRITSHKSQIHYLA